MTNLSLRDRRHQQALKDLARLKKQRDDTVDKLARITAKIKATRRSIERYERTPKPTAITPTAPANVEPPAPAASPPASAVIDEAIPGFLRRGLAAQTAVDAVIAKQIVDEQAERKRAKSLGRVAKLKAKQSGETKKMPLSGRAALEKIRAG